MKPLYHGTIYEFDEIDVSAGNLPKQYFFRTQEAVKTLGFDRIKRQVIG